MTPEETLKFKAVFAAALVDALHGTISIPTNMAIFLARNFIDRFAGQANMDLSEAISVVDVHQMMSLTHAQGLFLRYVKNELPRLHERIREMREQRVASLVISTVIVPKRKSDEGILIKSTAVLWTEIVELLQSDWSLAYKIPPERWEEIVAGAYKRAGFDEVTLTPRSGDFGRDVIAVKNGVGTVRVLGSVKAYRPDHLVTRAHVHEMMGVVSADPGASKGIITTTSDFAPRLREDQNLQKIIPYRIELMNGTELQKWLDKLLRGK